MVFNRPQPQPKFPTNEPLLKAITALAGRDTPEVRQAYYTTLLSSTLLLAREVDIPRPILLEGHAPGEVILPVFTNLERLRTVFPDATQMGMMTVRDLCQIALKDDIHSININPQNGPGCYLSRKEMQALANGLIPDLTAKSGTDFDAEPTLVPFGDSKLPSEEMVKKLIERASFLLSRDTSVREGYLILTHDGDESVLTIGLHFTNTAAHGDKIDLTQRLVASLEALMERRIRVIWLEAGEIQELQSHVEPFYSRDAT